MTKINKAVSVGALLAGLAMVFMPLQWRTPGGSWLGTPELVQETFEGENLKYDLPEPRDLVEEVSPRTFRYHRGHSCCSTHASFRVHGLYYEECLFWHPPLTISRFCDGVVGY